MKHILLFVAIAFCFVNTNAQIAVVTPSGSTSICPTIDSAISKANANDIIYLPSGNFNGFSVTKKVTIIGMGHHPDSSLATGTTTILGDITFNNYYYNANNSLIDGLYISGNINFNGLNSTDSITLLRTSANSIIIGSGYCNKFKFSKCIIRNALITSGSGIYVGFLNNSRVENCIIKQFLFYYGGVTNNLFTNNVFLGINLGFSSGSNDVRNNVFISWTNPSFTGNTFRNNILSASIAIDSALGINNIFNQTSSTTFINQTGQDFNYNHNYHLKPTSPGINSGTDGTDIGIYGGTQPWKDGNIPPNPHIYLKNVAPQTAADGKLLIQYKVRANN